MELQLIRRWSNTMAQVVQIYQKRVFWQNVFKNVKLIFLKHLQKMKTKTAMTACARHRHDTWTTQGNST